MASDAISTEELERRLDAELTASRTEIRSFQEEAGRAYEALHHRYHDWLRVAHHVRRLVQPRLEVLAHKFQFQAVPAIHHGRHRYQAAVTCEFPSDLARIKLRFGLVPDGEIRNLMLDYDLDILPIYLKFTPHERLVMALDAFEEPRVAAWLDDRLVDFTRTYLLIQRAEPYQREHMVTDPIANVRFPRSYAKMTLQHEGRTHYFISPETCWEFEKQHGLGAG